MVLLYSIIAALIVSLISLAGILTFLIKEKQLNKILFFLISFSAGTLMGGAFFHLIPESLLENPAPMVLKSVLVGFILFFVIEKLLHWHHCRNHNCEKHPAKVLGIQNLAGDTLHNFIDGLVIIAAFSIDSGLGIATTLSVALHEIPQEISDFGVLIYSGFSKTKAIVYNLASALFAVLGVLVGFVLISSIDRLTNFLIPIAAGGFIYIAASDLIPEINKEKNVLKSFFSLAFFVLALLMMQLLAH